MNNKIINTCSFIPFLGIFFSYFSNLKLFNYPLYAVYHGFTCAGITYMYIMYFYL